MKQTFYSVDELAEILRLHPKTIRRFLREGRISGRKIGRTWKVHHEELAAYAHAELSQPPAEPPEERRPRSEADGEVRVSAVVEIEERDADEASRISNSLIAMLNCKDPSWGPVRYDMMHDPKEHRARFILFGRPAFIAAVMKLFETIRGDEA